MRVLANDLVERCQLLLLLAPVVAAAEEEQLLRSLPDQLLRDCCGNRRLQF